MRLEDGALQALIEGKGIRRRFWVEYCLNAKYIFITDPGLTVHCLRDDLCADDWEILEEVDPKQKIKDKLNKFYEMYLKHCDSNHDEIRNNRDQLLSLLDKLDI